MQTCKTSGADVHTWTFANWIKTLKDLNVFCTIRSRARGRRFTGFGSCHYWPRKVGPRRGFL